MMPTPIVEYRDWVMTSSPTRKLLLFLGVIVVFFAAGTTQTALSNAVPELLMMAFFWIVLLWMLYTLYALGRGVIEGRE